MQTINHKQTWELTDRDGTIVAREEVEGWEAVACFPDNDELESLYRNEEERAGGFAFSQSILYPIWPASWEQVTSISCNGIHVGAITYLRECDEVNQ